MVTSNTPFTQPIGKSNTAERSGWETSRRDRGSIFQPTLSSPFVSALPDQWLAYMRRTLNDALAVSDGVNFTDEQSQHAGAAVRLGHGRVPVYELFAIGGASGRRWVAPALST